MAVLKSKGVVFKLSISSTLTAIPQIQSIEKSGEETETMDTRTLDGGAGLTIAPTGYIKPPTITISYLYDAALATHVAIKTAARAVTAVNTSITYTDSGPLTETWSCAGIGVDESIEGTKPITAKAKFTMSGSPS